MCEGGAHGGGLGTAVGLSSGGRRGLEREITVAVAGGWPGVQHSTGHPSSVQVYSTVQDTPRSVHPANKLMPAPAAQFILIS